MESHVVYLIVAIGIAVWGLISGLLVYIWRSDRKILVDRLEKLEDDRSATIKELLANPVLTISSHAIICDRMWNLLNDKLESIENNMVAIIKAAVLDAMKESKR